MDDFTPSSACATTADQVGIPESPAAKAAAVKEPEIPAYLQDTYYWA